MSNPFMFDVTSEENITAVQAKFFTIIIIILSFFQTAWHFTSASSLKFSHDDNNKKRLDFQFNKICISLKKQYNDQSHSVCVVHGFVVNKTQP